MPWPWSCGSWISNYPCNQCLSPLTLWVLTPLRCGVFDTILCDKVSQWLATGRWLSPATPVSSTNKTDFHDMTEISGVKHHKPNRYTCTYTIYIYKKITSSPRTILCLYRKLLNNKEFRFFLIGLNSFSQLYLRVSTPRVRYASIRACVYFCLLSIRFFNVVQPETRFHFQSANQITKKSQNFQKFQNISKFATVPWKERKNHIELL